MKRQYLNPIMNDLLGEPVADPEEEAFVVFSQSIPSQSLGIIDPQAAEVVITIGGRDLTIRQSCGLLTSSRQEGTTGAVVWKVQPRVAEWLASPNFLFQHDLLGASSTVLELGCGASGLVALTLAPRVRKYILTDQAYVLRLLKQNLAENLITTRAPTQPKVKKSASRPIPNELSNIETLELDWELNSVSSLPTLLGLQDSNRDSQGIDLIIACDCIYNESLIEPFNTTCAQICKLRLASPQNKPTLCLIAQHLRSYEVFEAWLKSFDRLFHTWQVPDGLLAESLRENTGFIVHIGIVR